MLKQLLISGCALALLSACSSPKENPICNELPIAEDGESEVRRNGTVSIDLLANASNPGCGELELVSFTDGEFGRVAWDEDAEAVRYFTLINNFLGEDSFEYTVSNDAGEATGTITVRVFERLRLQGQVVRPKLPSADRQNFGVFDEVTVTLSYADEDEPTSAPVAPNGDFELELKIYGDDSPVLGELTVDVSHEASGTQRQGSMHSVIGTRRALLDGANSRLEVDVTAQPNLRVSAYTSAFAGLTARHIEAELTESGLHAAAMTVSAADLQDAAVLNSALLEGLFGQYEVALPRQFSDYHALMGSREHWQDLLDEVRELELDERIAQSLSADNVAASMPRSYIEARHLELAPQLPFWVRAYGDTYEFSRGVVSRGTPNSSIEQGTYTEHERALEFSRFWDRAEFLYTAADSSWWKVTETNGVTSMVRLLRDSALGVSDEQTFDLSYNWVLPAVGGNGVELYYRFADDNTFVASHADEAGADALVEGEWALSESDRLLTLTSGTTEIQVRLLDSEGTLQLVRIEDVKNDRLRVGPALKVDSGLSDLAWIGEVFTQRLRSTFERLDPVNWRGRALQVQSDIEFLLRDDGDGTYGTGFYVSSTEQDLIAWEQVAFQATSAAIEMTFLDRRYYWLPLQLDDDNLWVLEWAQRSDGGEWETMLAPRINAYIRP